MMSKFNLFMLPSYLLYGFGLILGLGLVMYCLMGLHTIVRLYGKPTAAQAKPISPKTQPVMIQAQPVQPKVEPVVTSLKPVLPNPQPDSPLDKDKQQANIESNWQKADSLLTQRNAVIDRYLLLTDELNKKELSEISRNRINLKRDQIVKELDRINVLYKAASQNFGTTIAHESYQPMNKTDDRVAINNTAITHVPSQPSTLKTKTRPLNVGLRTGKSRLSRYKRFRKARLVKPGPAKPSQTISKA